MSAVVSPSERVSDSQIAQFAALMQERSWCIDVSLHPPRALHADSKLVVSPDHLRFECQDWLGEQGIRAVSEDQARSLVPRICQKLPRVMGSSFRPTEEKFFFDQGASLANTYKPFKPECPPANELTAGIAKLNGLAERLFPAEGDRKGVLQFLAHVVQKPDQRPQFGLLITGAGGTGKSLLISAVESALGGRHTWRGNNFESAMDKFSESVPDSLVVTFDDAPIRSKRDSIYDKLKFVITAPRIVVEKKSVQHRSSREVFARVIILTNEPKPFDLSEDRRFFVPHFCEHLHSRHESAEYFAEMAPWLQNPKNAPIIYHWLMSINLTDFDVTAPIITDTHRSMAVDSDQLTELIASYVSDKRIVHIEEVSRHAVKNGIDISSLKDLAGALEGAGYTRRRRQRPDKAGQFELWVPGNARRFRALNPTEIIRFREVGVPC